MWLKFLLQAKTMLYKKKTFNKVGDNKLAQMRKYNSQKKNLSCLQ